MSFLLQKSEENIKSAEHLIALGCYTSSIHCSYYASIQRILNFFYTYKGYSKTKIESEARAITSTSRKGLHEAYIEMISKEFLGKNLSTELTHFTYKIRAIKRERNKADYENIRFQTRPECIEVLNKSREVSSLIEKLER